MRMQIYYTLFYIIIIHYITQLDAASSNTKFLETRIYGKRPQVKAPRPNPISHRGREIEHLGPPRCPCSDKRWSRVFVVLNNACSL